MSDTKPSKYASTLEDLKAMHASSYYRVRWDAIGGAISIITLLELDVDAKTEETRKLKEEIGKLKEEIKQLKLHKQSVDEALNSGNGTYIP